MVSIVDMLYLFIVVDEVVIDVVAAVVGVLLLIDLTEASLGHWSPEPFEFRGKFRERRQAGCETSRGGEREMEEREEREEENLHDGLSC